MIGGGIVAAGDCDRRVSGIIVGAVALMKGAVLSGPLLVAELFIDQRKVVMGSDVFRIKLERIFETVCGLFQKSILRRLAVVAVLYFLLLKQGSPQFINHLIILRESKRSRPRGSSGEIIFEKRRETPGSRRRVDCLADPPGPPATRWSMRCGSKFASCAATRKSPRRGVPPGMEDREVQRPVHSFQFFDMIKGRRGLDQLAFLVPAAFFQEQPDAVVVPAPPFREYACGRRSCA